MKKTGFFALLVSFLCLFSACAPSEEGFFDYQKELSRVEGVAVCGDEAERGVVLYFDRDGEGIAFCRRIEYTSPDSLEGLSFTLEGGEVTASLEGVRIESSYFSAEDVFALGELFSLCEEDIYEIKSIGEERTRACGESDVGEWQVITDKEGKPLEIKAKGENGEVVFRITGIGAEKKQGS